MVVRKMIESCLEGSTGLDNALKSIRSLYNSGYSALDIIGTVFKVVKNFDDSMMEFIKLEFIKEIGFIHIRILDGVHSLLQLSGLVARLCAVADEAKAK